MKVTNVQVEDDRRCSASKLEKILGKVPVEILGPGLQLRARMGLGRIVYIEPTNGQISHVKVKSKLGTIEMEYNRSLGQDLTFTYHGQKYEVKYRRLGNG
jgi:hypothetical protein